MENFPRVYIVTSVSKPRQTRAIVYMKSEVLNERNFKIDLLLLETIN